MVAGLNGRQNTGGNVAPHITALAPHPLCFPRASMVTAPSAFPPLPPLHTHRRQAGLTVDLHSTDR